MLLPVSSQTSVLWPFSGPLERLRLYLKAQLHDLRPYLAGRSIISAISAAMHHRHSANGALLHHAVQFHRRKCSPIADVISCARASWVLRRIFGMFVLDGVARETKIQQLPSLEFSWWALGGVQ